MRRAATFHRPLQTGCASCPSFPIRHDRKEQIRPFGNESTATPASASVAVALFTEAIIAKDSFRQPERPRCRRADLLRTFKAQSNPPKICHRVTSFFWFLRPCLFNLFIRPFQMFPVPWSCTSLTSLSPVVWLHKHHDHILWPVAWNTSTCKDDDLWLSERTHDKEELLLQQYGGARGCGRAAEDHSLLLTPTYSRQHRSVCLCGLTKPPDLSARAGHWSSCAETCSIWLMPPPVSSAATQPATTICAAHTHLAWTAAPPPP